MQWAQDGIAHISSDFPNRKWVDLLQAMSRMVYR